MTYDPLTSVTDDLDDNLAEYHNELVTASEHVMSAAAYGAYVRAQSMTGNVTLTDDDLPVQSFSPTADRDLTLPAVASTNHAFYVINRGSYQITVKNASATTIKIVYAGESGIFVSDGANGWYFVASVQSVTTMIGMQLIRNSSNSLTVGVGSCFCENGSFLNISSALTADSLSLSNSTWYHVYVYPSSGSPAVEVVTTAPVTWKANAYSKTGDTSRRYVGSVKTDGSGNIYSFSHNPFNNYVQWLEAINATPFRVLNGGTATSATSVSASAVVPTTGMFVKVQLTNSGTAFTYLCSSSGGVYWGVPTPASSLQSRYPVDSTITSSGNLYYYVSSGGSMQIDIAGYFYSR